ncbi:MAG: hypothetical protein GY819_05175 [Planctomycetaceae bacterium]|nr:hypothetical protein [Planctomycetaceae bacterium]MDG1810164.1 hypothetical protein [Pirellulaceae bacterium]
MDIQFRCTNPSQFEEGGNHKTCSQLLQVSSEIVGMEVRCPRCNQLTVVPRRGKSVPDRSSANAASFTTRESVAQVEAELSYGKFSQRTRCPKCGSLLDEEKRCTSCRFETPLVKVPKTPLSQMPVKPAGFQLWFQAIMTDGVGVKVFEVSLHMLLLVAVIALIIVAVILGGTAAIYVILAALTLGFLYLMTVIQTKRMATVPGARLPFFLRPIWNTILRLARSQNWQKYDSRLKGRLIIDVRGENFGDRELLDLENLNICQVLDAEGTDITDNALAAMHGLKHLRCLVLRKTHVSHEAVFRLQQSLTKCWIWY